MSTINTSGIDANYPIPGKNNSTQGFRDNFASIKQNLDISGSEITDLQNKVVLKSALANSTLNNDMGNTLIANASVLQFRSTMYSLGNALVGNVLVNCSAGDVQYGNVAGNISLSFGSWVPTNTLGGVELQLGREDANSNYTITFPPQAIFDSNHGWNLIENSSQANSLTTITFPHDVTQINLKLTTTDCGNTIFVQPTNRPFQSTQIQQRTPPSTGQLGDRAGTVCVDADATQLLITGANTNPFFSTSDTSSLTPGLPVTFTGTSLEPNVIVTQSYSSGGYYLHTQTVASTTWTVLHNLGIQYPVVEPIDSTGKSYTGRYDFPQITYTSLNSLTLVFTSAVTGLVAVTSGGASASTTGTTYYIKDILTNKRFTLSSTPDLAANVGVASNVTGNSMFMNPVQYMYVAVQDFNAAYSLNPENISNTVAPNLVVLSSFTNIGNNRPIMFTGTSANLANVGLEDNKVYYIKNAWSGNNTITISEFRYNGIAANEYNGVKTVSSNPGVDTVVYKGSDIFRRTTLNPF